MGIWFSVSSCPEFLKVFIFFFFLFFWGRGVCSNISIKILIWATLIPKRKQSMWIKIEVFTSVWDQTAWIFVQSVLYVKEEFKAFLTTSCSPFYTAMYHMELLPAFPCTLLLSDFSWAGLPILTSSSSIPNFVVLLVFSKRSGNWRAVSGRGFLRNFWILLSLQIQDEKIIFSIFFINLFIKWKDAYD